MIAATPRKPSSGTIRRPLPGAAFTGSYVTGTVRIADESAEFKIMSLTANPVRLAGQASWARYKFSFIEKCAGLMASHRRSPTRYNLLPVAGVAKACPRQLKQIQYYSVS